MHVTDNYFGFIIPGNRTYSCYSSSNTDNFILFELKMLDNLCDERVHVTRAHLSSDGSLY